MKTPSLLLVLLVAFVGCQSRYANQMDIERRVFHSLDSNDLKGKSFTLAPIDPALKGSQEYQAEASNLVPLLTQRGLKFMENGQGVAADYMMTFEFALTSVKNTEERPHESYGTVATYPTIAHAAGESTRYSHNHNTAQLILRIYKAEAGSKRGVLVYEGEVYGDYLEINRLRLVPVLVHALLDDFPSKSGEHLKMKIDLKDIDESK